MTITWHGTLLLYYPSSCIFLNTPPPSHSHSNLFLAILEKIESIKNQQQQQKIVGFGAIYDKLRLPKLSKLWAILATLSAAISYTSFISTTGGPGTGPTYERTVAGIIGATLVAVHITVLVLTRNTIRSYIPWARTRELNPLTLVVVLVTSIIAMFLFKFPFVKLDGYTLCSVFAFAADVMFLELLVAPEYSMAFGWVYGCHMIVFLMLSAHPETKMPGHEVYHIIWFSVFSYLVGRVYFSGPVFP